MVRISRRAHERHRLRHRRAAHRARGRGRRAARAGAERRHDRARRAEAHACTCDVSDEELATRLRRLDSARSRRSTRGYWKLYVDHVLQADQGADLDFLVGKRGAFVPRDNH